MTTTGLTYIRITYADGSEDSIMACKPEDAEMIVRSISDEKATAIIVPDEEAEEKGYTKMHHEAPPEYKPFTKMPSFDGFIGEKHVVYEGHCCGRCSNRYRRTDFCDKHHTDTNCYRFKLEK